MEVEQLDRTKRQTFKWANFVTCLFLSFGVFVYGYFAGIISTTLTKPSFLLYMKLADADGKATDNSTGLIGATTGVFQAGGFLGLFAVGWVQDRFGRKKATIYLSIMAIISAGVLAGSQNIGMFIALRFFTGWCSFAFMSVMPTYTAELSPPNLRGLYVGMCGIWCALGFAVSTYFGIAFYDVDPLVQWRVPLALGALWPLIILIGVIFVPESPRYLILNNRLDEALAVMISQHTKGGEEDLARAEFYQMQKQADLDRTMDSSWSSFVTQPSYRKRAIIVIILLFIGQSSGNLVIQNYGGQLYSSLGYGTYDQLILQCGYISTAFVCSVVGGLLVDRIGRRRLLLTGITGCVASVLVETIIVAKFAKAGTNKSALRTGVAAFYLYEGFYCLSIDICNFVITSELFPNHLRAKGTAIAAASSALTNLVFLQTAPTGFANIGWKFYLVFVIIGGLGTIWIYFFIPETLGVPLEELADVFGGMDNETAIHARDIQIDHTNHRILDKSGNDVSGPVHPHGGLDEKNYGPGHTSLTEVA